MGAGQGRISLPGWVVINPSRSDSMLRTVAR